MEDRRNSASPDVLSSEQYLQSRFNREILSPNDITDEGAIRSHLKLIFQKTNTHRQAEVRQLISPAAASFLR